MKKKIVNSPLTGLECTVTVTEFDDIIVKSPLGGYLFIEYNRETDTYSLPASAFKHVELVNSKEAAKILGVTPQRLSAASNNGIIQPIKIDGRVYYKRKELLNYKSSRKVGRPPKDS